MDKIIEWKCSTPSGSNVFYELYAKSQLEYYKMGLDLMYKKDYDVVFYDEALSEKQVDKIYHMGIDVARGQDDCKIGKLVKNVKMNAWEIIYDDEFVDLPQEYDCDFVEDNGEQHEPECYCSLTAMDNDYRMVHEPGCEWKKWNQ